MTHKKKVFFYVGVFDHTLHNDTHNHLVSYQKLLCQVTLAPSKVTMTFMDSLYFYTDKACDNVRIFLSFDPNYFQFETSRLQVVLESLR